MNRLASLLVASLTVACSHAPTASPAKNPVTWFSVPASDLDAAAAFYARAFDWKVEPLTREADAAYDYRVLVTSPGDHYTPNQRGHLNGCLVKRTIGISTPVVLVEVDNLEKARSRIVAAGGTVTSGQVPMQSLNGQFFLATDPDGNVLEIFQPNGS